MQTLNIIGAGRVGQTLGRLWQKSGMFAVQDVLTNSMASALAACDFIGAGNPVTQLAQMRAADVWILAVPDAQIAEVADALGVWAAKRSAPRPPPAAKATPFTEQSALRPTLLTNAVATPTKQGPVAFHCSGAQSSVSLAPLAALGWQTASAHCILSFASSAVAVQQFPGTACALEGDASAVAVLRAAFTNIEARCFEVASQDKLLYHAAAVFATNFLPVIQSVAEDAWLAAGVPPELVPGLRASLLNNAVANITRLGPAGALTGPAARGDVAAIAKQAEAVTQWDAKAGAAYEALSALALRLAKAKTETSPTPANKS
jgi:predicted short-subunit dehydrogenase-like oxidoreductase (DUF2520 family)